MNDSVYFSIICPVYNSFSCLKDAVESVILQNYKNWELILVDDGSFDGSEKICDEYAKKYNNIHVIHQDNRGQSAARLEGIKIASGNYLLFLDSDDMFCENSFFSIAEALEKNRYDVVLFDALRIDGDKQCNVYSFDTSKYLINKQNVLEECFSKRITGYFWTFCFKKELLNVSQTIIKKYLNLSYSEDLYLIGKVLTNNVHSLMILPFLSYKYIIRDQSITNKQDAKKMHDRFISFNDVYESLINEYNLVISKDVKSIVGWTYLSYLRRAALEYEYTEFKKVCTEIRKSFIYKKMNSFHKDRFYYSLNILLKLKFYKTMFKMIKKRSGC